MAGCQAAPARQEKYLVRAPHTPCNEYQNGKDQRKVHIFTFFGRFVQPRWRRCASLPYLFVLSASARLASAAVRNAYLYLSSTCKTAKKHPEESPRGPPASSVFYRPSVFPAISFCA